MSQSNRDATPAQEIRAEFLDLRGIEKAAVRGNRVEVFGAQG
jgi:hypothetical protein